MRLFYSKYGGRPTNCKNEVAVTEVDVYDFSTRRKLELTIFHIYGRFTTIKGPKMTFSHEDTNVAEFTLFFDVMLRKYLFFVRFEQ